MKAHEGFRDEEGTAASGRARARAETAGSAGLFPGEAIVEPGEGNLGFSRTDPGWRTCLRGTSGKNRGE